MRFSSALAMTVAAACGVAAYDLRQLYSFEGGDAVAFCKAWKCNCINYTPADDTLYFLSAGCHPGDYTGANADTEVLASCAFTADGHVPVSFNDENAAETGATLMRFSLTAVTVALVAASGAAAYDLRELYSFQGGNGTTFCKTWKCNCINYEPKNTTMYFYSAQCYPGDYSGKHNTSQVRSSKALQPTNSHLTSDSFQALATCAFTADGKTPVSYSAQVAKQSKAKIVKD
ncbi:hypothetical protein EXIGLDRAFT_747439 [Exidia glandulosa HHB12029]|uniref:Uncharacterized protein n=1 Tax=Exidia glandulosa HHB12029 TaxID=1314781 RepID=A0A165KRM7_EXIGL|nr:hypothetical protein EXIGLDRAFT_747439 [Exidia glandulosa HHB12029]